MADDSVGRLRTRARPARSGRGGRRGGAAGNARGGRSRGGPDRGGPARLRRRRARDVDVTALAIAVVEDQAFTRALTVERLQAHFGPDATVAGFGAVEDMLGTGRG